MRRALGVAALTAVVTTACGGGRTAPVHRYLAYTAYTRSGSDERHGVWIAEADGSAPRVLAPGGITPTVSPDGHWVAFNRCLTATVTCPMTNVQDGLFVVSPRGGRPRLLLRHAVALAWSPRSDLLVATQGRALVVVDPRVRRRRVVDRGWFGGVSFSARGDSIAYDRAPRTAQCDSTDVYAYDFSSGRRRRLTRDGRSSHPVWGPDWIAYARSPARCRVENLIWRMRSDGTERRPVMHTLPRRWRTDGYYGVIPLAWLPRGRAILAGIASEWGPVAARVDVAAGALREIRHGSFAPYLVALSGDGRTLLVQEGNVEGPQTILALPVGGGNARVLVHGNISDPSWNR